MNFQINACVPILMKVSHVLWYISYIVDWNKRTIPVQCCTNTIAVIIFISRHHYLYQSPNTVYIYYRPTRRRYILTNEVLTHSRQQTVSIFRGQGDTQLLALSCTWWYCQTDSWPPWSSSNRGLSWPVSKWNMRLVDTQIAWDRTV